MSTSVQQALAQLKAAKDDPQKLAFATLDIVLSPEQPELATRLESRRDSRIGSGEINSDKSCSRSMSIRLLPAYLGETPARLPMIEQFSARQAWNVHEVTSPSLPCARKWPPKSPRNSVSSRRLPQARSVPINLTTASNTSSICSPHNATRGRNHSSTDLWNEWHPKAPDNVLALGAALLELDIAPLLLATKSDFLHGLAWRYIYLSDIARSLGQGQQAQTYIQRSTAVLRRSYSCICPSPRHVRLAGVFAAVL